MIEEIKQLNLSEEILKKYDIKSIQVMSEGNLEPAIHILFNNGVILNSNLHRYEITKLISSIKSDNRDDKINKVLNV
jgi:hypothetical protein